MTLVDRSTIAVWRPLRHALRATVFRSTPSGIVHQAVDDPVSWAAAGGRVIEVGGRRAPAHGRSWDHGVNVLALAPGTVVAYADNHEANDELRAAGITVIPVEGAAIAAGRGGPHCLACPLLRREAAQAAAASDR